MTFKGYEVLDWPEAVDTVGLDLKSKYNIIGDIWQNRQVNVQHNPYTNLKFTFFQDNNAERKLLRDFFIARKGKHERFWIRSFKNDLKLLNATEEGSNILYCEQGYDLEAFLAHKQFLYIEGHGTLYEILTVSEGYDEARDIPVVAFTVTPEAPFKLEAGCTIVEFAYFGRFDTDTLAFDYNDIWTSTVSITFREASDKEIELVL